MKALVLFLTMISSSPFVLTLDAFYSYRLQSADFPGISYTQPQSADIGSVPSGCTVITFARGGHVFFGGNDDFINPDTYYWVEQGDSTKYGVVWIGTPDNPQQGINEKGLAYDSNGLPRIDVNPHTERIPFSGEYHKYMMQIMHECSTVEEVTTWVKTHQRPPYMHDQLHFADKTGDAVVISAGKDGEMVFTRKTPGDGFLVSTNFNVANPSNGYGYPCWRYDRATEMLEKLMLKEDPVNVKDATGVLDAVHVEKGSSWTLETLVADLTKGTIYLYYYYQYDKPVILNLSGELANPTEAGPFSSLFPEEVKEEAARRYRSANVTIRFNNIAGKSWLALVVLSIALFFLISDFKKGLKFWLPSVIFLGPLALALRLLTGKQSGKPLWTGSLIETAGDVMPLVPGTLLAMIIVITSMLSGGSSQIIQILFLIIPLISSWFFFHGIMLSGAAGTSYVKFLLRRFPHVLITLFLGSAGLFIVAIPMVNKKLAMSQIMPLSPWIVMTWWAIIVAGSIAGGILLYYFEHWSVRRGSAAWSVTSGNSDEVKTLKLRKIWWWIPVGLIVLIAGMVIAVKLLQNSTAG